MATIGLRRPYVAEYTYTEAGDTVSYANGMVLAKAVEFSATIENASDNNLYADDGIAESDTTFSGGALSITTDDLSQTASALILGITPSTITIGEDTVTELSSDDSASAPDLGFGIIIPKMKSGQRLFRAVVFPKIKFSIPAEAATTQGKSIEWQTPVIEGVIMRDDTVNRKWKREATFDSEAKARAYIETLLSIPPEA